MIPGWDHGSLFMKVKNDKYWISNDSRREEGPAFR